MKLPRGAAGEKEKRQWQRFLQSAIDEELVNHTGLELINRQFARLDEHEHNVTVSTFSLSNSPCLNVWYRLFDPSHGLEEFGGELAWYKDYSPDEDHPVIYLSWFDAWASAVWFRWKEESCQLPRESQWEYACKFETRWDWNYWWGDEFDSEKANAENSLGKTSPPNPKHANNLGLMDLHGNVLEWCMDHYREKHDATVDDSRGSTERSRVLRGGSFDVNAVGCRSSFRNSRLPSVAVQVSGVRFARARKS